MISLALWAALARADEPPTTGEVPPPASDSEESDAQDAETPPPGDVPAFPSEDDLFGGSSTVVAPPPDAAPPPFDEAIPTITDRSIAESIGAAEDRFTIGGQIWLQFNGSLTEEQHVEDTALSSPSFADFFADARPNDRVRGYVRARFRNDFTVGTGDTTAFGTPVTGQSIAVDQFWLKFDAWQKVYFTVGKQRIRWGAGRFWNPTDFLQSQRLDRLAVFDVRLGVPLIKVHVPLEKTGTNLYAIANIDAADRPDQIGFSVRAEQVIGSAEVSASALFRPNLPLKLGADVSAPLGPLDVKVEAAALQGTDPSSPHWKGQFSGTEVPEEAGWDDRWLVQVVAGAELGVRYSSEDTVSLGVEYFHNEAGYKDSELYPWLIFNGQFSPFYLGRDYLAVYAFAPNPGKLRNTSFIVNYLGNLSDESSIARFDWRVTANTFLNLNAYVAYHFGENGEFHYGLDVPPIPTVPGLEDGLTVQPALGDVGGGLQITF